MTTMNPFDLLGVDDAEDPSQLIAAPQLKVVDAKKPSAGKPTTKPPQSQAKMPSKPLPPSQAVREARSEPARGGRGSRGGFGPGRGGGAYRDSAPRDNSIGSKDLSTGQGNSTEENNGNRRTFERRGSYGGPRGGRRGGFSNGEAGDGEFDRARRTYDRRSGTGQGNEMKREGTGRGNWGADSDEVAQVAEEVAIEGDKPLNVEKTSGEEDATVDADKEASKNEAEVKEPENKEMTLEEYEKLLEEKRKSLVALKTEERKVDPNEFASMQPLANKKAGDDVFIKLGSDKDKKKEQAEKEERAKKSMSINAFLKPADGEKGYSSRGRGRGGGGGPRGGASYYNGNIAPAIEDPSQFPSLDGK